jgi:hypothetical protein
LFTDGLGLSLAPCPSPFLWCRFSVPPIPSAVHVRLQFAVDFPVLLGGDQFAQGLHWIMFPGVVRGFLCDAWCSSVCSVNWCAGRFVAGGGSGEKWHQIFSVQHGLGRLSIG